MSKENAVTIRALARQYHALGINLLPLDANKHPMRTGIATNGKPLLFSWDAWQQQRQTANDLAALLKPQYWLDVSGIGAICGPVSGHLVCIDFDLPTRRRGEFPPELLTRFLDLARLPRDYGWTVNTPRGGYHVWLSAPTLEIDKGKLDAPAAGLPDGFHVEVRYTGHYAALPGSICDMADTKPLDGYAGPLPPMGAYAWRNGSEPTAPPAAIDAAVLLAAWAAVTVAKSSAKTTKTAAVTATTATHRGGERYYAAALAGEVANVRSATDGTRNDTLNTAAFNLGQIIGPGKLDTDTVETALLDAALAAGLGDGEALRTIRGALAAGAGKAHERTAPRAESGDDSARYDGFGESPADDDAPTPQRLSYAQDGGRKKIVINGRQDRDIRADAMGALLKANAADPAEPLILMRAGVPVALELDETGQRRARAVGVDRMQVMLADVADWVMEKESKDGELDVINVDCGEKYARRVLAALDGAGLPALSAVSAAPVFSADGELAAHYGYSARTKVFLDARLPLTRMGRDQALHVLLGIDGSLGDFDFAADSDRANALAAMLTPFCKNLFDGQSPMFVVEAPSNGDGKTLLMRTLAAPATAGRVAVTPEPAQTEWARFILAKAIEAPSVVMIDNIARQKLDSSVLASALTTSRVSGRVLGQTAIVDGDLHCTWYASGARPQFSQELARRVLTISLRSSKERRRPYLRTNPESWVIANRALVVSAITSIVQDWIDAGCPLWKERTMPSFDDWAAVLGGILHHAEVDGFLQQSVDVDPDTAAWEAFINAWAESFGGDDVTTADLFTLASVREMRRTTPTGIGDDRASITVVEHVGLGLLDELLDARSERGRLTQLGMFLGQRIGAVIAGYRIVDAGRNREKLRQFRIARIAPPPTASEPLEGVKNAVPAVPQNQGTARGTAAKMEMQSPQSAVPLDLFPLSHADSELIVDFDDHDHVIEGDRPKGTQGTAVDADHISKNAAVPRAVPQNQGTAGTALPAALQPLDGATVLLNGAQWRDAWDVAAAHGYVVIATPVAGGQRLSFRRAPSIDGSAGIQEFGL